MTDSPALRSPPARPEDLPAVTLARAALRAERVLPVAEVLRPLLPSAGLPRGRAVATRGRAALSLAMALVAEASAAGSWLALVDHPGPGGAPLDLGIEAAEDFGIALERVVRVTPGTTSTAASGAGSGAVWAEVMAAVLDGFELVVTTVPAAVPAAQGRRVQGRLKAREATVVVVGEPRVLDVDLELRGRVGAWEGLGAGAGHLRRRRVEVSVSGRRVSRSRVAELWLPGPDGRVAATSAGLERYLLAPELDAGFDAGSEVNRLDAVRNVALDVDGVAGAAVAHAIGSALVAAGEEVREPQAG